MAKIKCPLCTDHYRSLDGLYEHIEEEHDDSIPEGYTVAQYYYYLRTGSSGRRCQICKKPTSWNENTNRYNILCDDPECKKKYIENFRNRMINHHGQVYLTKNPEFQRKMLANRKISGKYKWSTNDKVIFTYTGTYEQDFLRFMDIFLNWDPTDIIMPSPHTYEYMYKDEKHFYIPDAFIPSLNLEVEIKESDNHHPGMKENKEKEVIKDNVLKGIKDINYIKILDKKYTEFFSILEKRKQEFLRKNDLKNSSVVVGLDESYNTLENEYINDNGDVYVSNIFYKLNLESSLDGLNESIILTEASIYEKRKNPVYITMMHTGTFFSNIIKLATNVEFSHVNISFDSSLHNAYSFGLKSGKPAGFKVEDIRDDFFQATDIPFETYAVFVTDTELKRMKSRLDFFVKNESKFTFNVFGCVKTFFNIEDHSEWKRFCSQFVADILNAGRGSITGKDPSLIRPIDFKDMEDCWYITRGSSLRKEWNSKLVDKITKKIHDELKR